ncbi:MAG TPA: pyridoxamine 5'-phosphate oxidase family protein [Gemmatimonadaceae bacterium]|nr:pyridoxamine 5'-phosphate oxidase family protein [Gemmatimonadaceae bacterium]
MKQAPQFFILTPTQCAEIMARNRIGRIAFKNGPSVDIEPTGYVARDSWLFLRSAYGAKLEALAHNPYVAFEVDEVKGPLDWASVVAHGTVYMLPADGAPIEQQEYQRAMEALREVLPESLTTRDPVPERMMVYGLHIDRVTGRMARSTAAKRRSSGASASEAAAAPAGSVGTARKRKSVARRGR